jgi:hypothetical protein
MNTAMNRVLLAVMLSLAGLSSAAAQGCIQDRLGATVCPPPGGGCVRDAMGNVKCSQADGGILLNRFQEAVCGAGQCVSTPLGEVFCSKSPKGYASVDQLGQAVCTGGCAPASASACVTPGK